VDARKGLVLGDGLRLVLIPIVEQKAEAFANSKVFPSDRVADVSQI
jgi:hypothetical protein